MQICLPGAHRSPPLAFCPHRSFVCPTEIIAFSDRAKEFEALKCQVAGALRLRRSGAPRSTLDHFGLGVVAGGARCLRGCWLLPPGFTRQPQNAPAVRRLYPLAASTLLTLSHAVPCRLPPILSCWPAPPTPPRCTWRGSRLRASVAAWATCRQGHGPCRAALGSCNRSLSQALMLDGTGSEARRRGCAPCPHG